MYHMGFGESPFPVHPIIQEAISGYSGRNQYLPAAGLFELRARAREHILRKHRIESDEFDAMIGPGSKELIFDVQLAVDGDLLFPAPSWVSYIPQTLITRDSVIRIELSFADHYRLSGERLEAEIRRSRAAGMSPSKLILNYPNNPTGLTYSPDQLESIADVCRRHDILVISDEIYAQVSFGHEHRSIASYYPERTVVTTGLSKHLSLGGFRLGVALVPRGLTRLSEVLRSIASETFSSVATPIQYSVLAAFRDDPEIERYVDECATIHRMVGNYVWRTVRSLGIDYPEPQGGFYLYPDFEVHRERLAAAGVTGSEELARHLLTGYDVATLPGTAFGDDPAALRLRISTVDFDGATALAAYRDGKRGDDLVRTACPRVVEGARRLHRYFAEGEQA